MEIFDRLKNLLFNDHKNSKLIKNVILLGILGMILIFAGNLFSGPDTDETEYNQEVVINDHESDKSYVDILSEELAELVSLIKGAGEARVMLLAESGVEKKHEYNLEENNKITSEEDQNQGERRIEEESVSKELVVISDSQGNEKPVVIREDNPTIDGVLIIAEGADSSAVRYKISKSISNFLNLPIYKVNVLPKERRDK